MDRRGFFQKLIGLGGTLVVSACACFKIPVAFGQTCKIGGPPEPRPQPRPRYQVPNARDYVGVPLETNRFPVDVLTREQMAAKGIYFPPNDTAEYFEVRGYRRPKDEADVLAWFATGK